MSFFCWIGRPSIYGFWLPLWYLQTYLFGLSDMVWLFYLATNLNRNFMFVNRSWCKLSITCKERSFQAWDTRLRPNTREREYLFDTYRTTIKHTFLTETIWYRSTLIILLYPEFPRRILKQHNLFLTVLFDSN